LNFPQPPIASDFPFSTGEVDPCPAYPTGVIDRPVIPIWVSGRGKPIPFFGLLDTGSDDTKFPTAVADELGVNLDRGHPILFRGVGGVVIGHYGEVTLTLRRSPRSYSWNARVAFLPDRGAGDVQERATITLGHAGFFRHFHASFDFQRGQVKVWPNGLFQGLPKRKTE
jgi:hypothetical protein